VLDFGGGFLTTLYKERKMKDKIDDKFVKIDKLFDLAYHWTANERYHQAIQCYTEILSLDHNNQIALDERLVCYSLVGNHDMAISNCIALIKSEPLNYVNYSNLGYALLIKRDYLNAIKAFSKAIKLNNSYVSAIVQRGIVYFILNEYENSIVDLEKASSLDNQDYILFDYIGQSYHKLGLFDNAIENFTKSIELLNDGIKSDEMDADNEYVSLFDLYLTRAKVREDKGEATGDLSCYMQARADYQFILNNLASTQNLIDYPQKRLVCIEKFLSGENPQHL
jgi:tetratricopeptide (TPR) repeat protein